MWWWEYGGKGVVTLFHPLSSQSLNGGVTRKAESSGSAPNNGDNWKLRGAGALKGFEEKGSRGRCNSFFLAHYLTTHNLTIKF